jgi:tryptophan synthase alpha chain
MAGSPEHIDTIVADKKYMNRIEQCFATLCAQNRAAFIPFVMGGDPDFDASLEILHALPEAGADIIELGMPFSDPMADGPSVQASALRALRSGQTLKKTLELVSLFREKNKETPLILMGYCNPIFHYGVDAFLSDAARAGVDGLIIVDCPAEVDSEICLPAKAAGLAFIRLITPTTNEQRLKFLLKNASGFLYLVTIAGVTGTAPADPKAVQDMIKIIKRHSNLPVCVGFGVKTPQSAEKLAVFGDGVVIASVLIDVFTKNAGLAGFSRQNVADYMQLSRGFASTIHKAREA